MGDTDQQVLIAHRILDEILAEEKSWCETIRVGDWVDSSEDATYTFSGLQYKTKDKLYRISRIDPCHDGDRVVAVANADIQGEVVHFSSSRVIIRDGEVIWLSGVYKYVMKNLGRDWSDYPGLAECVFDLDAAMREAGLCE